MQEKTINFLLALITGRVWEKNPRTFRNKAIDIWDCGAWIEFIKIHFDIARYIYETIKVDLKGGYHDPMWIRPKYLPTIKRPLNYLEKKKEGVSTLRKSRGANSKTKNG